MTDNRKATTLAVSAVLFVIFMLMWNYAKAHDHSRPELNGWFNSLKSSIGPCCSNSDGEILSDVDWKSDHGHYSVRIDGEWIDVPEGAVITEPNLAGPTMVWPMHYNGNVAVRCFLPGVMM